MKNIRPIGFLLIALLIGGAMFACCYWAASRVRVAANAHRADELTWLSREFHLTDAELANVRRLHEGYQPKCEAMCGRIAAKQRELDGALKGATNIGPDVERKLGEIAALRAECQAQMLRHFQEVARVMPAGQGTRYLTEMQRLTLGLHEQLEDAMAHPTHEHP